VDPVVVGDVTPYVRELAGCGIRRGGYGGVRDRHGTVTGFRSARMWESLPHASDPRVSLRRNTTEMLIADMEGLRQPRLRVCIPRPRY
jgi:hypothetical protein